VKRVWGTPFSCSGSNRLNDQQKNVLTERSGRVWRRPFSCSASNGMMMMMMRALILFFVQQYRHWIQEIIKSGKNILMVKV